MTENDYESEYTNGVITKRCIRCDKSAQMGRYKFLPEGWGVIIFAADAPGWSLCLDCLRWFKANSSGMAERMEVESNRFKGDSEAITR